MADVDDNKDDDFKKAEDVELEVDEQDEAAIMQAKVDAEIERINGPKDDNGIR